MIKPSVQPQIPRLRLTSGWKHACRSGSYLIGQGFTLLTEQKAAKMIDLLEELRRDLPNVKNRDDPEAVALQRSMNPDLVLAALDERAVPDETSATAPEINLP